MTRWLWWWLLCRFRIHHSESRINFYRMNECDTKNKFSIKQQFRRKKRKKNTFQNSNQSKMFVINFLLALASLFPSIDSIQNAGCFFCRRIRLLLLLSSCARLLPKIIAIMFYYRISVATWHPLGNHFFLLLLCRFFAFAPLFVVAYCFFDLTLGDWKKWKKRRKANRRSPTNELKLISWI